MKDFEIRGQRFRFETPNVGRSRPFLFKLTQKLASTGASMDGAGILALIGAVDEKLWNEAVELFTPFSYAEEDGRFVNLQANKAFWDMRGPEGLGDQYEWIVFAMKATYGDFLERIKKTSPAMANQ